MLHGETIMKEWDDGEQHFKLMQKLQAKHDKLFEKIVFAHREDKQDIVKSLCTELAVVRKMINMRKLAQLKLECKTYR